MLGSIKFIYDYLWFCVFIKLFTIVYIECLRKLWLFVIQYFYMGFLDIILLSIKRTYTRLILIEFNCYIYEMT